jgi:hypothetical protein
MGDVSHTLTSEGHDASEDGSGRGTPIVGSRGDVHAGPTGTLTRMYSEQSGQDFGGGAGVVASRVRAGSCRSVDETVCERSEHHNG